MIYFARHLYGGPIKIGTSTRVNARRLSLVSEYKSKIVVIGIMDGGKKEEKLLHRFFSSLRITGEWFVPAKCLFDFIAANAQPWNGIDPPAPVFPEREYQTLSGACRLTEMSPDRLKRQLQNHQVPVEFMGRMMIIKTEHLKRISKQKEA